MIGAFRSELVRLRRAWPIAVIAVLLSVVASLATFSGTAVGRGGAPGSSTAVAATDLLANTGGIVAGIASVAPLLGLLALVFFASSVARDLQTGTIRVLLVTQSRRSVYLAGKLAALTFAIATTAVVAVAVSVGTAFVGAAMNDVSTSAWSLAAVGSALLNTTMAMLGWGALGAVLAMGSRSITVSIAGGIGYLLLGEKLIGQVWSTADRWLPGGVLDAVFGGGTASVSYARSLSLATLYVAAAVVATFVVLVRRDVTD